MAGEERSRAVKERDDRQVATANAIDAMTASATSGVDSRFTPNAFVSLEGQGVPRRDGALSVGRGHRPNVREMESGNYYGDGRVRPPPL